MEMVGAARIELTTFCTQNRRATRLRYAPTKVLLQRPLRIGKPPALHSTTQGQAAMSWTMAGWRI